MNDKAATESWEGHDFKMKKKRTLLCLCICALLLGNVLSPAGVRAETKYTVTFYDRQGKLISAKKLAGGQNPVQVDAGKKYILDSLPGSSKETFLGWSLKPGKMTAPQFCAYYGKPIRCNLNFYAVTYPLSKEEDLTKITALNKTKAQNEKKKSIPKNNTGNPKLDGPDRPST